MGGVVDRGGGICTKLSPQLAVIVETKAELRQQYVSYEEAKRQLDFLEKGGDPLDFRAGNAASLSVQSTSLADQHPEHEAKGSFALAASPPGDSVESNGRPGANPAYDPNISDNLLLFDGENGFLKGERNSINSAKSNICPSEQSSQLDGNQNAKESGDSAAFGLPRKAYKRRNRSRPRRDGARSSSTDVVPSRGDYASFPSHHVPRDAKGLVVDTDNQKDQTVSSKSNWKATSPNCSMVPRVELPDRRLDLELDVVQAVGSAIGLTKGSLSDGNQHNQFLESDTQRTPVYMAPGKPESLGDREQIALAGLEFAPSLATAKDEDQVTSSQMNGLSREKVDGKNTLNEVQNSIIVPGTKGLDSESSCTQINHSLDGNIDGEICMNLRDGEICLNLRNGGSNGNAKEEAVAFEETPDMEGDKVDKENNGTKVDDICAVTNNDSNSLYNSHLENDSILKDEDPLKEKVSSSQIEVKDPISIVGMVPDGFTASENDRKPSNLLGSNSTNESENACTGRLQGSMDSSIQETPATTLSARVSAVSPERNTCSPVTLKFATKACEDFILEEARIIEAKRKRIAELSVRTLPLDNHRKSRWDFVLEEMAWLANDFAQERLWKISAAAQIGHQAASASHLKFHEQNSFQKKKEVAHNLAKAVMDFWHWVEETSKEQELQKPGKAFTNAVQGYALRFLKYNSCSVQHAQADLPVTPNRMSDLGILDMSWEVHLTEENLFYSVPAGGMETYRKSIESHLLQCQKTGSSMQEEVETSGYDVLAEFGSQENAFDEDEGETTTYYLPGAFDGSKSSKFSQKKRKHLMKAYSARSLELGSMPFMQSIENNVGNHQFIIIGKRSADTLNVLIPTKRVRTASRQRAFSPFNAGTSGCVQAPNKTDASSGDTNSFQDDQSTLQSGSHIPNCLEAESVRDFDKQLPFDSTEISHKPKKKKKAKNSGSTYHRWQMDSNFQNENRENLKRRLESHQLESNGSSGLYSQHVMKKPKMMKQSLDNSVDNLTPIGGSIPSPVASQMSNMSNPNKFIKMLGGRDRGQKGKALKTHAGQPSSGGPWSLFEDQALVVLVHDMGPNWELVSDAISSTLQFKCIFRKPKECKERHKVLMDSPADDGADSAEDSGSSETYRFTLPGIPKGSARQLFLHLQGPMEENTIKSHLEKIILIGKKQHHRRTLVPKQLQLPHNSHTLVLSQVCPNNVTGGPVLTPLDLCDATASSPDVLSLDYQSPHTGGLPISNQGTVAPMLPASGVNPSVQAPSNVVLGSNLSLPSGPVNASVKDSRFGIQRSASLSIDEQQKMQRYNQMLSGRNIQQSSMPGPGVHPGNDCSVQMSTGGNGAGIACGLNRSMPMARPGLQGIASSSILNSGSMLSSGMVAMPNPVNVHSGPGASQGNSMMRPWDPLHMMRPTQSLEHQRQMIVPELQMQVSQGNSQGVSPFGGLSSSSNQTTQPTVQSYPLHHQQPHLVLSRQSHVLGISHHPHHLQGPNHATNTQHQAYVIRLAKERQIQHQRLLQQQQQQQQLAPSNALMPHVQVQPQLPVSSSLNTDQLQSQTSPVPLSPLTTSSPMSVMSQHLQKHNMPPHGVGWNPPVGGGGLTNQTGKQRQPQPQQQQFQQAGRHHPQQRQQSQSQQLAKVLKGVGRGNILLHQNLPMDHSLLNGPSTTSGSQSAEKGEQFMNLIQGQGLYTGPGVNSIQLLKQLVPSHQAQPQQKLYSGQATPSKDIQQIPSHSDNSNQNRVQSVVAGPTLSTSVQAVPPLVISSSNPQQQQQQSQPQPHLKLVNQTQPTVRRVLHQNRQVNSDPLNKLQAREAQADLHPVNNSSQMGTTAPVPGCVDVANVIPVVSSASVPQRKASEKVYDPSMPNHVKQLGSGSPSLTNSGSEPMPPVSQGLGERQSSGSLPPVVQDGGVQWSKQSSQLQPATLLPLLQQQQEETQQQQSQQEIQLLQGGSNSLYARPPSTLN